jgi:hypothetical protein
VRSGGGKKKQSAAISSDRGVAGRQRGVVGGCAGNVDGSDVLPILRSICNILEGASTIIIYRHVPD